MSWSCQLDAEFVEQRGEHFEDFGVADGRFGAGGDGPRTSTPIGQGGAAPEAVRGGTVGRCRLREVAGVAELVLDVGADDAGGVLGHSEGLRFPTRAGAIFPGVHLLGDDVGLFADAAGEELGVLEDGGADLAEAVAGEDLAGDRFDVVPERGFGGKKIAGPADSFQG